MDKAKDNICPRCGGAVPNEAHKGEYVGALSRVCNKEICSKCGTDEAMRDMQGFPPVLLMAWPIMAHLAITDEITDATT